MTNRLSSKETWWKLVTGPREFVLDLLGLLAHGDSILVEIPDVLPWADEFWYQVSEGLKNIPRFEHSILETVEIGGNPGEDDFTEYLLGKYALRNVALGYRVGVDGVAYLVENHVLRNRIIRVCSSEKRELEKWIEFCSKWPKGSDEIGLFIVECRNDWQASSFGNLRRIRYSDYVTSSSVHLFNGLCLERGVSSALSDARKRYLASSVSHLCGVDVEVAEEMTRRLNTPPFDPIEAYRSAVEVIGREGNVSIADDAKLEQGLWEAQVETIFAVVQRRHMEIIDHFRQALRHILSEHVIRQYKERITDPDDVELGTLVYLMSASDANGRLLDVPDGMMRDEIHLLHACRNALAHRHCCTDDQVKQLLD